LIDVNVDEQRQPSEDAEALVCRLAFTKAEAGMYRVDDGVVLGSDTVVVFGDRVLGKPSSIDDAEEILAMLSSKEHEVLTAVTLYAQERTETVLSRTKVTFKSLSSAEIKHYVESGEPLDKAGAYGIQGLAGAFVKSICG